MHKIKGTSGIWKLHPTTAVVICSFDFFEIALLFGNFVVLDYLDYVMSKKMQFTHFAGQT